MRIGVIGSGQLGLTLGALMVEAGEEVMFSSRQPETLTEFAKRLGPRALIGNTTDAARHGRIVALCVPMSALPSLAKELAPLMRGKVLLDPTNPSRVGGLSGQAIAGGRGSGRWTARYFESALVVKAFNSLSAQVLKTRANRQAPDVAVPLAGDDEGAVAQVSLLVRAMGFIPIVVGGLDASRLFDFGAPLYNKVCTPDAMRGLLDNA